MMLPPWLQGGDGIAALLTTLSGLGASVVALFDPRHNVTAIAGGADQWAPYNSSLPALVTTGTRPAYDGTSLTLDGIGTDMLTASDPAYDLLSTGSILLLGSISSAANRITVGVRNASGARLELGTATGPVIAGFTNILVGGGGSSLSLGIAPNATRACYSSSLDTSLASNESKARRHADISVQGSRTGTNLAEDGFLELGGRSGSLFAAGVVNGLLFLSNEVTAAQLAAYSAFGVEQFGTTEFP